MFYQGINLARPLFNLFFHAVLWEWGGGAGGGRPAALASAGTLQGQVVSLDKA